MAGGVQILSEKLAQANARGRATAVGQFLAARIDRTVSVETPDGRHEATLRKREVGGGQRRYYFALSRPQDGGATAAPGVAREEGRC